MSNIDQSSSNSLSWNGFTPKSLPSVPGWIEPLGRAGYMAKGLVYGIIGLLAFQLAIGAGGETAGSRDAIREIGQQPFGRTLLALVAIGLIGYTVWRFVQAAKDTEGVGTDSKGIAKRSGYVLSGLGYAALGCFAGSIAQGWSTGNGNGGNDGASSLLGATWGQTLFGVAGLVTIAVALYFIYKGIQAKFLEKYALGSMNESQRKIAMYAGQFGLITRGVAFAILGGFIAISAMRGTSGGEIAGMDDALAAIAAQSYGKFLIGITGFGLICYAIHMVLMGIYRRFNIAK